ncbi:MAG: tyrosine--tRNA ligase [Candidatus Staskawiczbacteria bacterium]|jgi:tyrosyl-tRNA synthetase
MIDTNPQKIKELLERAVSKIYPSKDELEKVLLSGKKLRIYFGVDPTNPHMHLDHATSLFILRRLRVLGHEVVFLIGDFTAQIGDPTGKMSTRIQLSEKDVLKNCKNYVKMASKILDFRARKNPAKVAFNRKWLKKMDLEDLMSLMSKITIGKLLARDMFQKRIEEKKEIYFHEFMYPLLQGYDSVALDVDMEVGGSDQIFNMLVGRDLLKVLRKKEKYIIAKEILQDPKSGKMLMSKSEGRFIALDDTPNDMYGKIMALPDEMIISCFMHWTEVSLIEIENMTKGLQANTIKPMDAKAKLAREVVRFYHGGKLAAAAEDEFNKVVRKGDLPSEMRTIHMSDNGISISSTSSDLIFNLGLTDSKSEAKRLVEQGAFSVDGKVHTDWKTKPDLKPGSVIKAGKRKFIKIKE